MSIKTKLPTNEREYFKSTSPETKVQTLVVKKDQPEHFDLSDLHEAAQSNVVSPIPIEDASKPVKSHGSKKLGILERFLDDSWGVRIFCALGNEIAESFNDLAKHLLPKPIAKGLYATLWSLALGATGARVIANANQAESKDKLKAAGKLLIHDGISAITAPTMVARTMNFIQTKLYALLPLPATLKHLVKSIISILTCKFAIQKLDPIAMKFSGKLLNYTNDRHSEINNAGDDKGSVRKLSFASAA